MENQDKILPAQMLRNIETYLQEKLKSSNLSELMKVNLIEREGKQLFEFSYKTIRQNRLNASGFVLDQEKLEDYNYLHEQMTSLGHFITGMDFIYQTEVLGK